MSSCLSFRQDPNLKTEHLPDWRLLCRAQPEEASKRPMALSAISNSERLLMPVFRSSIYPARVNFDVIGGGGPNRGCLGPRTFCFWMTMPWRRFSKKTRRGSMLKLNNKQLKRSPCFKIFLTFLILSFFSLLMTGMQKPEPESLVYIALKVLMKAGAAPLASNTLQDHPSRHSKSKALLKSYLASPHPLLWEPTALIASLAAQIASLIFLGRT